MRAFENLLAPGSTELPECRCGAEMRLAATRPLDDDTEIRVFRCDSCAARVPVDGVESARGVSAGRSTNFRECVVIPLLRCGFIAAPGVATPRHHKLTVAPP